MYALRLNNVDVALLAILLLMTDILPQVPV